MPEYIDNEELIAVRLYALVLLVMLVLAVSANADPNLRLDVYDQELAISGPAQVEGIVSMDTERPICPREGQAMVVFVVSGNGRTEGTLCVNSADFMFVHPNGSRASALALREGTGEDKWLVDRGNSPVMLMNYVGIHQQFTFSVAFLVDNTEPDSWRGGQLRMAVPYNMVKPTGAEPRERDGETILPLYDQGIEQDGLLEEVESLKLKGGTAERADETSRLITMELEVTAKNDGVLEVGTNDFTVVDPAGNRVSGHGLRLSLKSTPWIVARKDQVLMMSTELHRGETMRVGVAFLLPKTFDWNHAQFRLMVPEEAIERTGYRLRSL